jgi:Leucine-rich repeat (LRR) protein
MKKLLGFIVLLLVLFSVNNIEAATSDEVYFADENLKAAVKAKLGITNPTEEDMLNLTTLVAKESGIADATGIEYATNLTWLQLSDNQLTSLPESIGNLTNLTNLFLYSNQLTSLPESIGNPTNLTWLQLYDNQLTSLPESIGDLTNLTDLYLDSNQLTSIPESIGDLTNLTYLGLYNNQLTSLPESIGNLTNLVYLYLDNNQLNTDFYCNLLNVIISNNPLDGNYGLEYDPNPNPMTDDCSTNFSDIAIFTSNWSENNCDESNNWCGGAYLNHVDDVNLEDFAEFISYWLN